MSLKEKIKGLWIAVPADKWRTDRAFIKLSKEARSGWLLAMLWSKDQQQDGAIDEIGLQQCLISDGERDELLKASFLVTQGEGYRLAGWADTQQTQAEAEAARTQAVGAGQRSGEVRRERAQSIETARETGEIVVDPLDDNAKTFAARICAAWPQPDPPYHNEAPKNVQATLEGVERSYWPQVAAGLNEFLRRFRTSERGDRRKLLGQPSGKVQFVLEDIKRRAA